MLQRFIEATRLTTNYALRQLLGSNLLGDIPHTEVDTTDLLGHDTMTETPVRIETFAGAGRHLPVIATSMLLSTVTTVFFLSALPADASPKASLLAANRVSVSSRASSITAPAMTPLQARVKYMQQIHEQIQHAPEVSPQEVMSPISPETPAHPAAAEETASGSDQTPASPVAASGSSPLFARADNKVGVYLTASSVSRTEFFDSTIENLLAASGSALVMDVKGGSVLFHSAAPMANDLELVKPFYELPEIIRKLHERNIYLIGRFVSIKDAGFTEKMPETKIRNPKTGQILSQTWVDPSNQKAIDYNMEVVCELAAAGVDEINLDYIRFSTAEFGALGVYSPVEKADRVEAFIKAARETINRCGPSTRLGLSTFAILGWAYDINVATLGQDVVRFSPLVDVISPMAYPATFTSEGYYVPGRNPGPRDYYLVYRTLKGYADLLGPEESKKLRPWIQGYGVSAKDVTDEMRGVYDAGFCGFTVWNAGNNYKPVYQAFSKDTIRPARCTEGQTVAAD